MRVCHLTLVDFWRIRYIDHWLICAFIMGTNLFSSHKRSLSLHYLYFDALIRGLAISYSVPVMCSLASTFMLLLTILRLFVSTSAQLFVVWAISALLREHAGFLRYWVVILIYSISRRKYDEGVEGHYKINMWWCYVVLRILKLSKVKLLSHVTQFNLQHIVARM